ncbi:MAG TPA: sulfatase-like hydrolase/transferase, partial [Kofleriaceae bacterium]|nr:sulfatase-like hydrolase/transferase [Kofleriaceae bacterium]
TAPALLLLAVVARWIAASWRPHVAGAATDGGGAPRVWAWFGYILFAAAALVAIIVNAVAFLARATAFKARPVAFLLPVLLVPATLGLVALSRPVVDVLDRALVRLGARGRRRGRRPRLTVRAALVTAAALIVVAPAAGWYLLLRPKLGYVDMTMARYPVVALVILACAHALPRLAREGPPAAARAIDLVGRAAIAAALLSMATALYVWWQRPVVMLELWARPTMAGEAVDRLFDLERVRRRLSEHGFPPAPIPGAAHPDIILITIDTVRGDHTPVLGGPAAMPNLVALADRGATFEWAFSPGNVTRRSLSTIITGASPSRLRGRLSGWALRMDPRHVALGERFRAAGYETAGFFCCESFFARNRRIGLSRGLDHLVIDHDGTVLAAAARDWLMTRRRNGATMPAFVWIHFIEPHNWRDESHELASGTDTQRYDFVLGKVDKMLGTIFSAFERAPGPPLPIIVVTADHGEGLGDHGAAYHSTDLYDSQTHVPLVIAGPGIVAGRHDEVVGLVDLAPTLLELGGFLPPGMPEMDGRSLADLLTGRRVDAPDGGFAYSEMVPDRNVSTARRSLVIGRYKLIESPHSTELYDVRADPGEHHDLATEPSPPPALAELRAALTTRRKLDRIPAFAFARD